MRLFWSAFWSLLLSGMAVYVVASMNGGSFSLTQTIVLAVVVVLSVTVLSEGVLTDDEKTSSSR
ncbi:DeoR family transcriptional regulator [Pontibacillus halophilus JSM 076056 = DSM 19796]|uniref:DeoR family transcriptional regulator n=1 Tax=Pontibacillus halophilus JSM 076056 = DSM 19796 TaxID=1385510 RepID=A0A0A5GL14_9BACI|nr:DUF2929 family protein [Pontibacillus halophilus]KGX92679.1 DeoR family transcriptional regulator [Pontibacillus halophilus JSM 076056 = DSM 19796]